MPKQPAEFALATLTLPVTSEQDTLTAVLTHGEERLASTTKSDKRGLFYFDVTRMLRDAAPGDKVGFKLEVLDDDAAQMATDRAALKLFPQDAWTFDDGKLLLQKSAHPYLRKDQLFFEKDPGNVRVFPSTEGATLFRLKVVFIQNTRCW